MNVLNFRRAAVMAIAMLMAAVIAGCKHSGVAVSGRGQVMSIGIDVPTDLSEGETRELKISIGNRGVNKIGNVLFEVEMPNELIVLSQVPSRGVEWIDRMGSMGTKIFQYRAGNIEVATTAEVTYHVRAAFGSLERTGDIKVTAWSEDLPGNQLTETKFIKLRR